MKKLILLFLVASSCVHKRRCWCESHPMPPLKDQTDAELRLR